MLDQNTDRMWYVIGAVIVGAAIILILNGTAPELFASVAETFEEKTGETLDVVDGLRTHEVLVTPDDVTPNSSLFQSRGHDEGIGTDAHTGGGTINPVLNNSYHSTSKVYAVDGGTAVHLSKETSDATADQYWRVSFMDEHSQYHSRWVSTKNDWVLAIPEGALFFRVSYPTDSNPSIRAVP